MITLPPSLPENENFELLVKAKGGNIEAKELFFAHNMRLMAYVTNKFENSKLSYEDRFSAAQYGFLKAYNTFSFDKDIKFATYSTKCMANEILMFLRKEKSRGLTVSLDEPLNVDWDGDELVRSDILESPESHAFDGFIDHQTLFDVLKEFRETASQRDIQIIEMRYLEEKSQRETAKTFRCSQSYVSRLERKALNKLRKIAKVNSIIKKEGAANPMGRRPNANVDQAKLKWMFENDIPANAVTMTLNLSHTMYYNYKNKFKKGLLICESDPSAAELLVSHKVETVLMMPEKKQDMVAIPNQHLVSSISLDLSGVKMNSLEAAVNYVFSQLDSTKKYNFQISLKESGEAS